jgi:hypothetical protein
MFFVFLFNFTLNLYLNDSIPQQLLNWGLGLELGHIFQMGRTCKYFMYDGYIHRYRITLCMFFLNS